MKKFHLLISSFLQNSLAESYRPQAGQIQTTNSVPGFLLQELILHRVPNIIQAQSNSTASRNLSCKATYVHNKELTSGQIVKLTHTASSLQNQAYTPYTLYASP